LLRCARNDGKSQFQIHNFALAARCARAVHLSFAPEKIEGVGNAGCPLHPQPRAHFVVVEAHE
jgi:hypothetical protein